jgi:hypothetical protein
MILAIYVIGSAIALIVLTIRLRDTRDQLGRMRRERNAYARTLGTSLLTPADAHLTVTPADGTAPPGPVPVSGGDGR